MQTERFTRRSTARAGALLVAGGSWLGASCAGAGLGGEAAPKPVDLKGVLVEHWTWNGETHPESIAKRKVVQDFASRSGMGVEVRSTAPTGDAFQKVVAALAAGTPPDLLDGQHFWLSDLARQGALVDVDTELKSNPDWKKAKSSLSADITAAYIWKGKQFGIPLYSSHFAMYFQPNLLSRVGLPAPPPKTWTWEQFLEYCRAASRPPEVTGFDTGWTYADFVMAAHNNGARAISQDGTKLLYNSPEMVETAEWQLGMIRSGLMRAHDGTASGGRKELIPEGRVVFQRAVAARVPLYRQQGFQFGTCYYPLGPGNKEKKNHTHGEAYGFTVFKNKDAKKQQGALLAALWGTRPDMGLVLAQEAGVPPSYRYTIEDPAFQAQFKKDAEAWPFYELLAGFIPMPGFPAFGEVRQLGETMLGNIWAGKGTARAILDEYNRLGQQKLDEILRAA